MNNDVDIGQKSARFLYYRYKDSPYYSLSLIVITIVVCLFLLIQLVIPQLTQWFSIRDEVLAKRERITQLEANIAFLDSLNERELDSQLLTATSALPPEKDFASILRTLSDSAIQSSVALNDYAFQVGTLSSQSAQKEVTVPGQQKGLSSMIVSVSVTGNITSIAKFLKSVQERLPLSDITQMEGSGRSVTLLMEFYYKPFPSINPDADVVLTSLSANDENLLNSLSVWREKSIAPVISSPSATASAVPLF